MIQLAEGVQNKMKWFRKKEKAQVPATISIEEQRAEKLAQMGSQLRATREQHGFSLEEAVMYTRIPRKLLQGIEEANLEDLPEPVYIQGLIRQYADALGYKGAEFASAFPVGTTRVSLKPVWRNPSFAQLRPIHLYLLYVFLIVGSITGLSNWLSDATMVSQNTQPSLKPDTSAVSEIKPTPSKPESITQTNSFTKGKEEVQVGITLKETSWIQVIADGKTTFEGTLNKGTKRSWTAKKELTVKAGNAGGVLISVNQQAAKKMGEPGKIEKLRVALSQ